MNQFFRLIVRSNSFLLGFFQAKLKKHEALMSDLEAFNTVIEGLREQSLQCKVCHFLLVV